MPLSVVPVVSGILASDILCAYFPKAYLSDSFNRMYRFLHILLLFVFTLGVRAQEACSQEEQAKADAFYYDAMNERLKGNHAEAFQLFTHALAVNPNHVGANYGMSSYYHVLGSDEKAGEALKTAADHDAGNYWVKHALVQLYVSEDKTDEAIRQLEDMAASYPQNSNILFMLEELYQRKPDYQKVIETLDRIELLEGKNEEISTEKYRIYIQMNDKEKAFAEMRELADEYPNDLRYKARIGDLYLDSGETEKAYEVYQQLQQEDSTNVNVLLSLAHYYETTHQDSLYQQNLMRIVTNTSLPEESRMRLMQTIAAQNLFGQQGNDTTKVMGLFDKILQQPQENNNMAELYVRYMISSNVSTSKVKPVLQRMLDTDPEADIARNQLLSYAIDADDDKEVMRLCKTAVDYASENPVYYYYLSVAYLRNKRYNEAIDANRKGLAKTDSKSNLDMIVNMYTIMGDCYHYTGRNARAFECYDSCLLYKPNDVLVLNNYAYYLSLEKRELEKAERMASKAIELEKDNATYIDTYAWVLFQQQKYAEAKVYIDQVLNIVGKEPDKDDATLIEHAGDIYSQCGFKDKALEYWKQAQGLGVKSKTLERKIKKKKYIE